MKKVLLFISCLLFSWAFTAQNFKSPVEYLEFIGAEQTAISKSMWNYNKSVAHTKSAKRVDATRNQLVKTIETATKKIQGLQNGYDGDKDYQEKVIEFLNISKNMINNDYENIIDLKEVAEQSYDYMEAYIKMQELINQKSEEEFEKVKVAQQTFADKYNIILTEGGEDDLSKKLRISNEIFTYQNQLYLIFFKTNYTYGLLNESIGSNDLTAIQQNGNTLHFYAKEGIEKLNLIEAYNKDNSLINATKTTLEYYDKNTLKYVTEIVDFTDYMIQFEDIKNALDRKSPKDRTKEEVDRYNAMVKDINKKIKDNNMLNNKFLQDVNQINQRWHTTSETFASKHIPKS